MSTTSSISPLSPLTEAMRDESISLKSQISPSFPSLSSSLRLSDAEENSAEDQENLAVESTSLVSWGVYWKQPALIITFAFCGLAGAIGHHVYYHFMDSTIVSSMETQQWALRFGTAFSVFTITMLRAAVVASYNQYIWKVVREKSFSVADLDKIFSLTSDFTGFFSLALLKYGRLVILLASLCWLLPLAGLTPASTLSVVTSLHTEITNQFVPSLDSNKVFFQDMTTYEVNELKQMLTTISEKMVMPQLHAPAPNSSYTLQFYGPTLLCQEANGSEQAEFDQYSMEIWNASQTYTSSTFQMFNDGELVGVSRILGEYSYLVISISQYLSTTTQSVYNQLWVQTANRSIVCSTANASFEVHIDYPNGVQSIAPGNIDIVNVPSYSFTFTILVDLLAGIVSFGQDEAVQSTELLLTGLITCDEIFWWMDSGNCNGTTFGELPSTFFTNAFDLPDQYSLCRNRSLSLAIQDLANNFTISFLSNPNMTVNVSTPVTIITTQNIYQYDSRNLIISYAIGINATIFAVIVGLMAIHSNGVCHRTSFSAIMASTSGNPQIAELSKRQSLGAEPLSRTVAKKKLRLGVINVAEDEAEKDEWGDPINRIGFGLEGTVMKLIKGAKGL